MNTPAPANNTVCPNAPQKKYSSSLTHNPEVCRKLLFDELETISVSPNSGVPLNCDPLKNGDPVIPLMVSPLKMNF